MTKNVLIIGVIFTTISNESACSIDIQCFVLTICKFHFYLNVLRIKFYTKG